MNIGQELCGGLGVKNINKKISIGTKAFALYLSYIIIILGFEWVDCICYEFEIEQVTLISRLIVMVLFGIFLIKIHKDFEVCCIEWNGRLIIGVLVILGIGLLKSVYPDTAYDTYNYHLIAQTPGFENYFVNHFAKGSFQVWGFRLGDRLFYLFREILGYRYGTLLNTFVLTLSYLQIRELLKQYFRGGIKCKNNIIKTLSCTEFWALMIVLSHYNVLNIGIYYVDIVALPVGLEVLRKIIEALQKEQTSGDIFYMALLNGVWFAFKMTNIVFVAPCVILYIVLVKKKLDFRKLVLSGILAAIPCLVYLIVNGSSTGNPIFPYFNTLFQSPYYADSNFKDLKWGGQNLFQKIFWLGYMIFRPEYRQSEIPDKNTFILIMGCVSAVIISCRCIIKLCHKKWSLQKEELVVMIVICSSLLWSFTTGYSRYYQFGMVLIGVLAYYILGYFRTVKGKNVIILVATFFAAIQMSIVVLAFMYGREWSWNRWKIHTFKQQCSKVFRDYEFSQFKLDNIDMFFITDSYYTGVAHMIAPDIYTHNAVGEYWVGENVREKELQEIENKLLEGKTFDIKKRDLSNIEEIIQTINEFGMQIVSIQDFTTSVKDFVLIELKKTQEEENNKVFISTDNILIDCEEVKQNASLQFICGRCYNWEGSPRYNLRVLKRNFNDEEEVYQTLMDNVDIVSYEINLGEINDDTKIVIEFRDLDGKLITDEEVNRYFVINPIIK